MNDAVTHKKAKKGGGAGKLIAGLLLLILVLLALGWLFRTVLAEKALASWCARKDLNCAADVSELSLGSIELSNLVITSGEAEPLTAGKIEADLSWPSLFKPRIEALSVSEPVLRAAFDGEALSFYGLRNLVPEKRDNADNTLPAIEVSDGQVYVDTPAGEVSASITLSGSLSTAGRLELHVDPAELIGNESQLVWSEGDILLNAENGRITGIADLMLEQAVLGTLNLTGADIHAEIEDVNGPAVIKLTGRVDTLTTSKINTSELSFRGQVQLSDDFSGDLADILARAEEIAIEADAASAVMGENRTGPSVFKADFLQQDEYLAGPVSARFETVETEFGRAELITLSGSAAIDADAEIVQTFSGALVVEGASLGTDQRQKLLASLALPGVFESHGTELRRVFDRGLTDFDTGVDIDLTQDETGWAITARRATILQAASGLMLSIEPFAGKDWLSLREDDLTLAGDVIIEGGGAPSMHVELDNLRQTPERLQVATRHVNLARWAVNKRAVALAWDRSEFETGSVGTRLVASGNVSLDGEMFGVDLRPTTLSGGIEAGEGQEGWRVQMLPGETCIDFATQGMQAGVLQILPVKLPLCPEDGRFLHAEDGASIGAVELGDVTLPFRTNDSTGDIVLTGSVLNWQAVNGLALTMNAAQLDLPIQFGSRTLNVSSQSPRLSTQTGEGPMKLNIRLSETIFAGSMVPADVTAASLTFDGYIGPRGVNGHASATDVLIKSLHVDPLYQPLRASFSADFVDGQMHLFGPVRLATTGLTIADADMNLQLASLTGSASILGRTLEFTSTGLQPKDLSERLRDVLPNARGALQGSAQLTLDQGNLVGTGRVAIAGFGVDTFRMGPVDGVNGEIIFSDLLGLTTYPGQVLTIERINPGVVLENGQLSFQLLGGREARLEAASWPFAGGVLAIEPTSWRISGETDRITVRADKISLTEISELLSVPDLEASGTVSGAFPIDIIGPNAYIRNALLKADEQGGRLRYSANLTDQASATDENVKLAFDALRDFKFTVLELGMDGNIAGEMLVSMKLVGRNDDVLGGTEFKFNVGVTSELARLIRSGQQSTSGEWVVDMIKENAEEARTAANE